MQKPTDGAQRPRARLRPDRTRASSASRINGRSIRTARAIRSWLRALPPALDRRLRPAVSGALRPLLTAERALPIAVAAIVAVASLLALLPAGPTGAVGGTTGAGQGARIAIGGGFGPDALEALPGEMVASGPGGEFSFQPLTLPPDITGEIDATGQAEVAAEPGTETGDAELGTEAGDTEEAGAFLDDGTLLTGYAPETTVEDGADLVRTYKVKSGDTLSGIARQFGVKMMTLWWANKLKTKDELHVGQVLRIPPVNGLVVTVKATDTLESLAAQHKVKPAKVVEINGLEDPTLVAGQVLVLPGAKGEPIPTPKPTPKPVAKSSRGGSGGGGGGGGRSGGVGGSYSGGAMRWPVVGGGNYISQRFRYGHYGLDIAGDYGTRIVAAARGKVIFAGWKSNGGGYQVWISHGGGMYTTYNHMAGVSVGTGQSVERGQQIGRLGASGNVTGPHLHFEVWRGPIWDGGSRTNPLRFF